MTTSRLITEIHWEPGQGFDPRADLVLSDEDKVRLDPSDHCVKLKLQSNFRFPLDANLSAQSRTYRPEAVRNLLMLQLNAVNVFDEDGIALTSVMLRIYDGTNDRFWNGSVWAVAGTWDWNSEDEVNQHLSSFDVSSKQFAVVLNLVTTDDRYTPLVSSVFVLWEGEVDWSQDIVLDSLTQTLQDELEYASDTVFPPLEADSNSIDLDDYTDESDLVVADVEEVYDHDADPNHTTDLLDSYDSGTRVVTLTSTIPMGNRPYFRLKIRASVAWDTHQDFSEIRKLPQVILGDAEAETSVPYPFGCSSGVVRKDTGSAVKLPASYRTTYRIVAEVLTDRSRDQLRLLDALTTLLTNGPSGEVGPFLRSRATDRRYRIWLTDEFRAVAPVASDLADVRVFRAEFRVVDVMSNFASAIDTFAVKSLNLGFSATSSEEERRAILDDAPIVGGTIETTEVTSNCDVQVVQQAKLISDDAVAGDQLGVSASVYEDTCVVGACLEDDSGSAYVFVRTGVTWSQQVKLVASDAAAGDYFGGSVAISGDTCVVGASGDDSWTGSAYVFIRSGEIWTQQAKLIADDASVGDCFGTSVAIDGDTCVVGTWNAPGTGCAYVFVRSGGVWTQQAKLTAGDVIPGDYFGESVAISGDTCVVGTYGPDVGSAYIFVRSGDVWTQQAKLVTDHAVLGVYYFICVGIDVDTCIVTAYGDDPGDAYVFVRTGVTWTQQAKFTSDDAAVGDYFGIVAAIDGDVCIVGACGNDDDGSDSGSAYIFVRVDGVWSQRAKLTAGDASTGDQFGMGVSINGNVCVVGSWLDDGETGGAYTFTITYT